MTINLWYRKASVFVVAGVVYLAGQYFRGMWFVNTNLQGFCRSYFENGKAYCNSPYMETLGWPLIHLGQTLAIAAIILLFANAVTFRKWLKFSLFYIPIATALTLWMYPAHTPLGGVVPISQGVYLFGGLFVISTLSIVIRDFFIARRAHKD